MDQAPRENSLLPEKTMSVDANLPRNIRVHWAVVVPEDFHARFSALSRRYRYVIEDSLIRSAVLSEAITWHRRPLDTTAMAKAAIVLLGEQDFSAFRASGCQSSTPMRDIQRIEVTRCGALVVLDVQANAFLYHMVRNIVGSLIPVGIGEKSGQWFDEVFQGRDRNLAGVTAGPQGLCFMHVRYDPKYKLPDSAEAFALK